MAKKDKKKASLLENRLDPETNQIILHNIEEIRSMRDEINWRVKVAYNSSIAFISVTSFVVAQLFSSDNSLLETLANNPDMFLKVSLALLVLISAWVGVQNANHLIEKRIELYTLELMRTIYAQSQHVFFSWLGYLYGSVFFKTKAQNLMAKFLNASIGLFLYFLPNLVALCIWWYLSRLPQISNYPVFFTVCSVFVFVAIGTSFFLFFYVIKVNNYHTSFYKNVMKPYYRQQEKMLGGAIS